jgi:hypothetical protein
VVLLRLGLKDGQEQEQTQRQNKHELRRKKRKDKRGRRERIQYIHHSQSVVVSGKSEQIKIDPVFAGRAQLDLVLFAGLNEGQPLQAKRQQQLERIEQNKNQQQTNKKREAYFLINRVLRLNDFHPLVLFVDIRCEQIRFVTMKNKRVRTKRENWLNHKREELTLHQNNGKRSS